MGRAAFFLLAAATLAALASGRRLLPPEKARAIAIGAEKGSLVDASSAAAWTPSAVRALGAGAVLAAASRGGPLNMWLTADLLPPPTEIVQLERGSQVYEIVVPKPLADKFDKYGGPFDLSKRLRSGGNLRFKVDALENHEQDRDTRLRIYADPSPGVYTFEQRAVVDGRQYVLTEDLGTRFLQTRLQELRRNWKPGPEPLMPFEESLPYLLDIIRGAKSLNAKNMVHFDLTEDESIVLVPDKGANGDGPAVITNLGKSACIMKDRERADDCGCARFIEQNTVGTVSRLAPEPVGPSNNAWQVGNLAAKMFLGEYPTDVFLKDNYKSDRLLPDWLSKPTAEERQRIQNLIRNDFQLADNKDFQAFKQSYPDAAGLLEGTLEKDPQKRWDLNVLEDQVCYVMTKYGITPPTAPNSPESTA